MAKQAQHTTGADSATVARNEPSSPNVAPSTGLRAAEFMGLSADGHPLVQPTHGTQTLEVRTTIPLTTEHIGETVLLATVDGFDHPVVTGRVLPPSPPPTTVAPPGPVTVHADGQTVAIEAEQELVLRCGEASLVLRRDGFVELCGVDVVSRAERGNWIKGGSISLN
ncbi:MAG: DUF6484 domain-containing protein [Myxococcota bacterium]